MKNKTTIGLALALIFLSGCSVSSSCKRRPTLMNCTVMEGVRGINNAQKKAVGAVIGSPYKTHDERLAERAERKRVQDVERKAQREKRQEQYARTRAELDAKNREAQRRSDEALKNLLEIQKKNQEMLEKHR